MSLAPPLAAPRGIDKRLVLAGVLLAAVAFAFWTGSRYPSLDNKAMMAGDAQTGTCTWPFQLQRMTKVCSASRGA